MKKGQVQGYDGGGNMIGEHKELQFVDITLPKMHYHWCGAPWSKRL